MLVGWARKFTLESSQNWSETKLQGVSFNLDLVLPGTPGYPLAVSGAPIGGFWHSWNLLFLVLTSFCHSSSSLIDPCTDSLTHFGS